MCDPNDGRWYARAMECLICGDRWWAVHCACPERLECECGYMNAIPDDADEAEVEDE